MWSCANRGTTSRDRSGQYFCVFRMGWMEAAELRAGSPAGKALSRRAITNLGYHSTAATRHAPLQITAPKHVPSYRGGRNPSWKHSSLPPTLTCFSSPSGRGRSCRRLQGGSGRALVPLGIVVDLREERGPKYGCFF